jgi:hypothetical protein
LGTGVSETSELWFGASISSSTACVGSSENPWSCSKTNS